MKVNSLEIEIDKFDDDAMFEDRTGEVCRILRELASRIEEYGIPHVDGCYLKDTNGNTVGNVSVDWEEDEEGWDGDSSDISTCDGCYGSGRTPCTIYYCSRTNWYAVEGSCNVNQAPYGFEFEDGVWVEEIEDLDTCTVSEPINGHDDLAEMVWEQENT